MEYTIQNTILYLDTSRLRAVQARSKYASVFLEEKRKCYFLKNLFHLENIAIQRKENLFFVLNQNFKYVCYLHHYVKNSRLLFASVELWKYYFKHALSNRVVQIT